MSIEVKAKFHYGQSKCRRIIPLAKRVSPIAIYIVTILKKHRQFIPAVRCEYNNKNNKCALQSPSNATMEDFYKDLRRIKIQDYASQISIMTLLVAPRTHTNRTYTHTHILIRLISYSRRYYSYNRIQYIRNIYILYSNIQQFRPLVFYEASRNV